MNRGVQAQNLALDVPPPSSERSFSQELWSECNACCDWQQFFCCVTFILFVIVVFAAILAVLIYFKPVEINVKLHSLKVNNYTVIKRIEENNQSYYAVYVIAYIDFVFLATNPSKKFTIAYNNSTFKCLTRSMPLGVFTTGAFRQQPLSSTNWTRVLLLDVPEPVPSSLRVTVLQDAFLNGVVSMNIGGSIVARFEVAEIFFPSIEDTLNCSVEFKYLDQSNVSITC